MEEISLTADTASSVNSFLIVIIVLLCIVIVMGYRYYTGELSKMQVSSKSANKKAKVREKDQDTLVNSMSQNITDLTKNIENTNETSAENMRELLKIKSNNIEVFNEKFTISHMLDELSVHLPTVFKNIKTEVIFNIDDSVPQSVSGDIQHITKILNNILEFSIQSTPLGSVTMSITSEYLSSVEIVLYIKIQDTSNGLKRDEIATLFDFVYDEENDEHVGLRLHIAKRLADAIDGELEVSSRIGRGNTFDLQIPLTSVDCSYDDVDIAPKDKRVLISGQHTKSNKSLQKLLSQFYSNVTIVEPEMINENRVSLDAYELLIYDTTLFNMDNNTNLKKLREEKNIQVISTNSIFASNKQNNNPMVDCVMQLPSNREKIIDIIADVYLCEQAVELPSETIVETVPEVAMEEATPVEADTEVKHNKSLSQLEELHAVLSNAGKNESPKEEKNSELKKSVKKVVKQVATPTKLIPKQAIHVFTNPIDETPEVEIDDFAFFKGLKLLIVEDNLINQKIIMSVLKKSEMDINIANNGEEALALLLEEKRVYDIILMDISMPIMDGFVATKKIREHKEFDHIPIVTFTAFARGVEIEQMFKVGTNAFLTKPLNVKKLYTVFDMFLTPIKRNTRQPKVENTTKILDTAKGIYVADESEILYKETLKEFVSVYGDMIELTPKWMKEKNYDMVKLSCTDIRPMLDAISASDMKNLVDEILNNILHNNAPDMSEYIVSYPKRLMQLMQVIKNYL